MAVALLLILAFLAGYVVNRADAPATGARPAPTTSLDPHAGHQAGGLSVAQDGFLLEVITAALAAGRPGELALRIVGPDGTPVTDFRRNHEKDLHLILVRRDLTGYQHLHPEMDADGTWRTPVTLAAAGSYRAYADFQPIDRDQPITLGADLHVPGRYDPAPLPPPEETVDVDGYMVTLDAGVRAGEAGQVLVWLGRNGEPVNDLQSYLGAYGHLVALREGDLAYLHVHPALATAPSSVVAFGIQVPTAGRYRLYFEFRHDDVVRRAEFTIEVPPR